MMSQSHKETIMTSISPATPSGNELPVPASAIVAMLFDDLVASIDEAMRCIDAGQIEARFRALTQATDIVGDLAAGLDEEATDDWSKRTEALYGIANDGPALALAMRDRAVLLTLVACFLASPRSTRVGYGPRCSWPSSARARS